MFRAHVLIARKSKQYYTASGIIKPIGGLPVHRCTGRPPIGVMISESVQYRFDLLTVSTCARNM